MIDRRTFLLGGAGLLTLAFARQAKRFATVHGEPLLMPVEEAKTTLHLFANTAWSEFDVFNKWQVALGPFQYDPPPASTWRRLLEAHPDLIGRLAVAPEAVDSIMPADTWGFVWEHFVSPQARAHRLLKALDVEGWLNAPGRRAGSIDFIEAGHHPGSSERLVELKDDVSVSLLQAALVERQWPVRLMVDD